MKKLTPLFWIILLGAIIRIAFFLIGAKFYFGRSNIFVDGDTEAWAACFENLLKTGTYTVNPESEWGYFGRMPGYSFFIGFFYLICGSNWETAYPVIAWTQTIMDVVSIYTVYLIAIKIFNQRTAIVAAFLYAFYPFIIVWNPVVYSELPGIFFMLLSLLFLVREKNKYDYIYAGLFLGISSLMRPQCLLVIPGVIIFIAVKNAYQFKLIRNQLLHLLIAFTCIFGLWPARNIINHKQPIITQDLRGFVNWDKDVVGFLQYIYSVKAEWQPQFGQILSNKQVTFPSNAYTSYEDSLKLEKAIYLSKTCGRGFSYWPGYWKPHVPKDSVCNDEIVSLYAHLRETQIQKHPFNFYVKIPLQNLSKALFKVSLSGNKSGAVVLAASSLFLYRSILIVIGLIGLFLLLRKKQAISWVFLMTFLAIYLSLCAGTSPQMRNIEMRYFIHADILLLFPAAYLIYQIIQRIFPTKEKNAV